MPSKLNYCVHTLLSNDTGVEGTTAHCPNLEAAEALFGRLVEQLEAGSLDPKVIGFLLEERRVLKHTIIERVTV